MKELKNIASKELRSAIDTMTKTPFFHYELNGESISETLATITPESAEELLKFNTRNRALSPKNITFLANQMKNGEWQFTGNAIAFDTDSVLSNGQHTLSAIIKAGTPQTMKIQLGLKPEVFKVFDTQKGRGLADILSMAGISEHGKKSTLSQGIILFTKQRFGSLNRGGSRAEKATNTEGLAFVKKNNAKLQKAINVSKEVMKGRGLTGVIKPFQSGTVSQMFYLFAEKCGKDATKFMEILKTGHSPDPNSPIIELRSELMQDAMNGIKHPKKTQVAMFINAWNLFRGKKVKSIKWKTGEAYPVIY